MEEGFGHFLVKLVDAKACVASRLNQHLPNHKSSLLLDCVGTSTQVTRCTYKPVYTIKVMFGRCRAKLDYKVSLGAISNEND